MTTGPEEVSRQRDVPIDIRVDVRAGHDDEVAAEFAAALRREVDSLEVGVTHVEVTSDPDPDSRGIDLASLTTFFIALPPTLHALRTIISAVDHWVSGSARSVSMKVGADVLELHAGSAEEQSAFIDAWIRARALERPTDESA